MKSVVVVRLEKYLTFHLAEILEELRSNAEGESDRMWSSKWGRSASVLKEHLIRAREEITSALFRIQKGTYGDCLVCGNEIMQQRLEVVPWLRFCVVCQEDCERQWSKRTHEQRQSQTSLWG